MLMPSSLRRGCHWERHFQTLFYKIITFFSLNYALRLPGISPTRPCKAFFFLTSKQLIPPHNATLCRCFQLDFLFLLYDKQNPLFFLHFPFLLFPSGNPTTRGHNSIYTFFFLFLSFFLSLSFVLYKILLPMIVYDYKLIFHFCYIIMPQLSFHLHFHNYENFTFC